MLVSEWAEKNIILPGESGAERGPWRNSRAPYQVEVMDALVQPGIETIVIIAGSQTGKTAIILNMKMYIIDQDPGPILYVQPTKDTVKDFSIRRVAPMIAQCPVVAQKVAEARSRDKSNSLFMKEFPGGSLAMTGANSPAELASRPIRWLFLDEVDRFPASAGTEGDPIKLATARTKTYKSRKVITMVSSPTDEHSKIEERYSRGTQEDWRKKCPGCGEYTHLVWEQLKYDFEEYRDREGKKQFTVKWVRWECPHCKERYKENEMLRAPGKWVVNNPLAKKVRSFRFSALSSPWVNWEDVVQEYLEAGKDETLLKPFYNTTLGVVYKKQLDTDGMPETLYKRREIYDDTDVPKGALVLTMGVDAQVNRLEYEIVGWGYDDESWGIQRGMIMGRPELPAVWKELDKLLDKEWTVEGSAIRLKIAVTFVDSGYKTEEVYKECLKREGKRVFPIKGEDGQGRPYCYLSKTKQSQNLFIIGVDTGKEAIQSAAGEKDPGPLYCHWPVDPMRGYDLDYFKGLFSEKAQVHTRNGKSVMVWEKVTSDRNEPLDCRNYARAGFKKFTWPLKDIEARLYEKKTVIAKPVKSRQISRGVTV